MNNEIRWFVRLGLDQNLFTRAHCRRLQAALGDDASLLDFAQRIIDDGICTNVEALEHAADLAVKQAHDGKPLSEDPFLEPGTPEPSPAELRAAAARQAFAAELAEKEAAVALPQFDFAGADRLPAEEARSRMTALLAECGKCGASDLHLSAGARPFIRRSRVVESLADHVLTEAESLRLNSALLTAEQLQAWQEEKDYDCALSLGGTGRYRVNLMFHRAGPAGCYRIVPDRVKPLAELGFRNVDTIHKLLAYHNGLILVTGPVGSGKTTTLAALVSMINQHREDHIITVEDPIEVVQKSAGCNVTQREVGRHTDSFFSALKGALREDPDVIVIGELRDLETIEMAITAAETGHLVIGTMHTSDAATTLGRLLDVFPAAQQTQIRASVAESLRGIVCQKQLPAVDGGIVLACEIMVANAAVANLIRENKPQGLRNVLETGVRQGMCLMDNVVFELWSQGRIDREVALANIGNRVLRNRIGTPGALP